MKKSEGFVIVFLGILVILTIFTAIDPNFGQWLSVSTWFTPSSLSNINLITAIGLIILVCFLGALIPFPVPYAIPLATVAFMWHENIVDSWGWILILVFFAAVSNTVGDSLDYLIGRGAQYAMARDDPEQSDRWSRIIISKPKAIPWIIFLFALTPLPDSMLLVPLGIVKYPVKKTLLAMFLGKFCMMLVIALAGIYTIDPILSLIENTGSRWTGLIILYIVWLIVLLMTKIKIKKVKN